MGRRKLIEDEELLAKAREIFVREGSGVSSRKLAKEIGISNSVLFQRFGSMVELLFAAMIPPAPDMSALLSKGKLQADVCAELEQVALGLLEYFRTLVPVLLPLATHPSFEYEDFRRRHPHSPLEKLQGELMREWEEKRTKGQIECPDVGPVVLNLMAVAYSLAMFERIGVHHGEFSQEIVRQLARLMWRGIAPASQRKPRRGR